MWYFPGRPRPLRDTTLCTTLQYSKYKTASFAAHSTFITDPEQQVGSTYSTKIDKIQKSDIKTPLRRIMRKKASQRNTPLSFEKARIENTNTWLVTLFPERTNENGTPLILTAGKPSIKGWFSTLFGGIGIENFSACPWLTQPDLTKQLKRFFKNRNRRSC